MKKEEIQNLIQELIEKTLVQTTSVTLSPDSGANLMFSVQVNEPHFFIGRDGEALLALNHLVNRMIENKTDKAEEPLRILVDINDFQKKKIDAVRAIAHMMGERARYFKANVEVDPMSAFERRIVHEFLANAVDLQTESAGFGPTRHVIIKYIGGL